MNYSITQTIARVKETATGTMANGNKFNSCIYFNGCEWKVQLTYFEIESDGCINEVTDPNIFTGWTKAEAKVALMNALAA
jgi:hypothetical protein